MKQGHHENVLETIRVREVVGTVTTREALDELVTALMWAGFDRSDIDLLASREAVMRKLHAIYADPIPVAQDPDAPRRELIRPDDEVTSSALIFGTLITIGTLGATLPIVASGGAAATAVVAALAGGIAGAGVAKTIKDQLISPKDAMELEDDLRSGGLVVLIRVRNREMEERAQDAMVRCGAQHVHVHEIELKKTSQDLPLANIRPDPWLGDERLGA
jgi:hypothetical protein